MADTDASDERHQDTSQDTERLQYLSINRLPDEVLLEIFDSYRQAIDPEHWKKNHVWRCLAQVCGKWRAIMFASFSRLNIGVTVGPEEPGHIKMVLSGHLPIFIDYKFMYGYLTGSALWRMRAALKQCDRVREISFAGTSFNFSKFFKAATCPFPALESLIFRFRYGDEPKLPDTFLRGQDLSILHLRRLKLYCVTLPFISGFLLSATALTELVLQINTISAPSEEASLLACLQGMPSLRHLDLSISFIPFDSSLALSSSTSKDIVPLSKLTFLRYVGPSAVLDALVAGVSAPSLRDVELELSVTGYYPAVHLLRFINEIEEHYHAVHVAFQNWMFSQSLLTQSEYINRCSPRFKFGAGSYPESILLMSGELSLRFTTVEELRVTFDRTAFENNVPWRKFYQQFPSVKVLRIEGFTNSSIARSLLQGHEKPDDDLAFLPALEEIELAKHPSLTDESQFESELAAFHPFVSARQEAGRPVKVFFGP